MDGFVSLQGYSVEDTLSYHWLGLKPLVRLDYFPWDKSGRDASCLHSGSWTRWEHEHLISSIWFIWFSHQFQSLTTLLFCFVPSLLQARASLTQFLQRVHLLPPTWAVVTIWVHRMRGSILGGCAVTLTFLRYLAPPVSGLFLMFWSINLPTFYCPPPPPPASRS